MIRRVLHLAAFTLCVAITLSLSGGQVDAYMSIRVPVGSAGQGVPVRWDLNNSMNRPNIANGRILYEIADAGSADADGFTGPVNEFEAVQNSFATWRDVHESDVDFEFAGATTNAVSSATDNRNVIRWVDSNISAGVLGVTITSFDSTTGEITDADMELNDRDYTWDTLGPGGTNGVVGRAMIENVVTHEIGHVLGFDHPQNSAATLYFASTPGLINQAGLEDDDRAILVSDYTNQGLPPDRLGTVSGSVTANGNPRFGVYVTLVDVSTGRNVVGHASENSHQSFTLGDFEINGVPPGNYFAFALPIDKARLGSYYQNAFINFYPVVHGVAVDTVGVPTPVKVAPGETVTGVNIGLPGASQNPFEDDDDDTQATPIVNGEVAVSGISPTTEEDWFSFTTTQTNQKVTIRVLSHVFDSSLNPTLTLYGTDGTTVLVSPDSGHPQFDSAASDVDENAFDESGVNFDAEIVRTIATPGTYYFAVASRAGATSGHYIVTLEADGIDLTPDSHASTIEADTTGVEAGSADTFDITVTPRNLFGRGLHGPNTFDVELLDVSGSPVVLDTITNASTPFTFTVNALGAAQVVTYGATIDGVPIEATVKISHYGSLSVSNSRIKLLETSLNANGYDRIPVKVELRDGSGNNPLPDSAVNVTLSTTAGTLDNGSNTGATNVAANFDNAEGAWFIDLVAPTNTGTATLTAFADGQQIDSKQVQILARADGTGGGAGNGGGGGGDDDDDDGGCTSRPGRTPALLLLVVLGMAAVRRRVWQEQRIANFQ